MRKIPIVFILIFMLSSCSLQEKVSPEIFIQRLCAEDENIMVDDSLCFNKNNVFTAYFSYADSADFVLETDVDGLGNAKKINLACAQTDKVVLFKKCVESVISVYSPDENTDEIIDSLFPEKESYGKFTYYETRWYVYSAVLSEKGLYFSSENKKLSPQNEEALSLKPNDIIEY